MKDYCYIYAKYKNAKDLELKISNALFSDYRVVVSLEGADSAEEFIKGVISKVKETHDFADDYLVIEREE